MIFIGCYRFSQVFPRGGKNQAQLGRSRFPPAVYQQFPRPLSEVVARRVAASGKLAANSAAR
jgi:hypothetical protein